MGTNARERDEAIETLSTRIMDQMVDPETAPDRMSASDALEFLTELRRQLSSDIESRLDGLRSDLGV